MTEQFDETKLRDQLEALNPAGQILFALSMAERMLPNFRSFTAECGWGDESVLRKALDLGWAWLEGGSVDAEVVQDFQNACLEQAPQPEEFSTFRASSALDAANSAAIVCSMLIELDADKAVEIASYGRDTVDMFVQELEWMAPNAPDLEERIRLHPLMQRELRRQQDSLVEIAAGLSPGDAAKRWRSLASGSIDFV